MGEAVRRAGVGDAAEVGRLLHEFAEEFDDPTPGPEELARRAGVLIAASEAVFLLGGVPAVGIAQIRLRVSVWSGRLDATLEDLFVQAPHRGRGYGSALLEAAQSYASERGAAYMEIAVYEGDREALALYLRRGFRHWEAEEADLPDGERPNYLFLLKSLMG